MNTQTTQKMLQRFIPTPSHEQFLNNHLLLSQFAKKQEECFILSQHPRRCATCLTRNFFNSPTAVFFCFVLPFLSISQRCLLVPCPIASVHSVMLCVKSLAEGSTIVLLYTALFTTHVVKDTRRPLSNDWNQDCKEKKQDQTGFFQKCSVQQAFITSLQNLFTVWFKQNIFKDTFVHRLPDEMPSSSQLLLHSLLTRSNCFCMSAHS